MAIVISLLVAFLAAALVIWIVSRMGLGLSVDSFGTAFLAAIVIAIVSAIVYAILGALGLGANSGLIGAIINLIVSAIILLISGNFLKGLRVEGFTGAIVASIAIAVVSWLLNWVLSLVGIGAVA
ncbi:MAG: phage holin family protein [Anaerolineae bacterium]